MFGITSCVLRLFQVNNTIVSSLRTRTLHETITLRGIGVLDKALLGLEVKCHRLAVVFLAPLLEQRFAVHGARCVYSAVSLHRTAVHIHGNLCRGELHVLVLHFRFSKKECQSCFGIVHHRVFRHKVNRCLNTRFAFFGGSGICSDRINGSCISNKDFDEVGIPRRQSLCECMLMRGVAGCYTEGKQPQQQR